MEASLTKTHSGSRECLVGRLLNAVEYNDANDSEKTAATQASKNAFMMTTPFYGSYIRLLFIPMTDRRCVSAWTILERHPESPYC